MRIISGIFRGKKLIKFNKVGIKPTTDKMRESIFNIVISYLKINEKSNNLPFQGFNVLDIFNSIHFNYYPFLLIRKKSETSSEEGRAERPPSFVQFIAATAFPYRRDSSIEKFFS